MAGTRKGKNGSKKNKEPNDVSIQDAAHPTEPPVQTATDEERQDDEPQQAAPFVNLDIETGEMFALPAGMSVLRDEPTRAIRVLPQAVTVVAAPSPARQRQRPPEAKAKVVTHRDPNALHVPRKAASLDPRQSPLTGAVPRPGDKSPLKKKGPGGRKNFGRSTQLGLSSDEVKRFARATAEAVERDSSPGPATPPPEAPKEAVEVYIPLAQRLQGDVTPPEMSENFNTDCFFSPMVMNEALRQFLPEAIVERYMTRRPPTRPTSVEPPEPPPVDESAPEEKPRTIARIPSQHLETDNVIEFVPEPEVHRIDALYEDALRSIQDQERLANAQQDESTGSAPLETLGRGNEEFKFSRTENELAACVEEFQNRVTHTLRMTSPSEQARNFVYVPDEEKDDVPQSPLQSDSPTSPQRAPSSPPTPLAPTRESRTPLLGGQSPRPSSSLSVSSTTGRGVGSRPGSGSATHGLAAVLARQTRGPKETHDEGGGEGEGEYVAEGGRRPTSASMKGWDSADTARKPLGDELEEIDRIRSGTPSQADTPAKASEESSRTRRRLTRQTSLAMETIAVVNAARQVTIGEHDNHVEHLRRELDRWYTVLIKDDDGNIPKREFVSSRVLAYRALEKIKFQAALARAQEDWDVVVGAKKTSATKAQFENLMIGLLDFPAYVQTLCPEAMLLPQEGKFAKTLNVLFQKLFGTENTYKPVVKKVDGPGPGSYVVSLAPDGPRHSFGVRRSLVISEELQKPEYNPGPGAYKGISPRLLSRQPGFKIGELLKEKPPPYPNVGPGTYQTDHSTFRLPQASDYGKKLMGSENREREWMRHLLRSAGIDTSLPPHEYEFPPDKGKLQAKPTGVYETPEHKQIIRLRWFDFWPAFGESQGRLGCTNPRPHTHAHARARSSKPDAPLRRCNTAPHTQTQTQTPRANHLSGWEDDQSEGFSPTSARPGTAPTQSSGDGVPGRNGLRAPGTAESARGVSVAGHMGEDADKKPGTAPGSSRIASRVQGGLCTRDPELDGPESHAAAIFSDCDRISEPGEDDGRTSKRSIRERVRLVEDVPDNALTSGSVLLNATSVEKLVEENLKSISTMDVHERQRLSRMVAETLTQQQSVMSFGADPEKVVQLAAEAAVRTWGSYRVDDDPTDGLTVAGTECPSGGPGSRPSTSHGFGSPPPSRPLPSRNPSGALTTRPSTGRPTAGPPLVPHDSAHSLRPTTAPEASAKPDLSPMHLQFEAKGRPHVHKRGRNASRDGHVRSDDTSADASRPSTAQNYDALTWTTYSPDPAPAMAPMDNSYSRRLAGAEGHNAMQVAGRREDRTARGKDTVAFGRSFHEEVEDVGPRPHTVKDGSHRGLAKSEGSRPSTTPFLTRLSPGSGRASFSHAAVGREAPSSSSRPTSGTTDSAYVAAATSSGRAPGGGVGFGHSRTTAHLRGGLRKGLCEGNINMSSRGPRGGRGKGESRRGVDVVDAPLGFGPANSIAKGGDVPGGLSLHPETQVARAARKLKRHLQQAGLEGFEGPMRPVRYPQFSSLSAAAEVRRVFQNAAQRPVGEGNPVDAWLKTGRRGSATRENTPGEPNSRTRATGDKHHEGSPRDGRSMYGNQVVSDSTSNGFAVRVVTRHRTDDPPRPVSARGDSPTRGEDSRPFTAPGGRARMLAHTQGRGVSSPPPGVEPRTRSEGAYAPPHLHHTSGSGSAYVDPSGSPGAMRQRTLMLPRSTDSSLPIKNSSTHSRDLPSSATHEITATDQNSDLQSRDDGDSSSKDRPRSRTDNGTSDAAGYYSGVYKLVAIPDLPEKKADETGLAATSTKKRLGSTLPPRVDSPTLSVEEVVRQRTETKSRLSSPGSGCAISTRSLQLQSLEVTPVLSSSALRSSTAGSRPTGLPANPADLWKESAVTDSRRVAIKTPRNKSSPRNRGQKPKVKAKQKSQQKHEYPYEVL
eukprot:Rmarinus@m.24198